MLAKFFWHLQNLLKMGKEILNSPKYPFKIDQIAGYPLWLEKLENEPFSEFDWKSWKTIGFSPALPGKAGILFLGLIIINSIIRLKMIVSRRRIEEEKIVQYHVGRVIFH